MLKPKATRMPLGGVVWDKPQTYLIEYVLFNARRPMRAKDVQGQLRAAFGVDVLDSNLSTMLSSLVRKRRVIKMARGVYQHVASCEDSVDIFS